MKMQFIGKNNSLGYITGKTYDVSLKTVDDMIVLMCKGHLICPYSSLKALANNWKDYTEK